MTYVFTQATNTWSVYLDGVFAGSQSHANMAAINTTDAILGIYKYINGNAWNITHNTNRDAVYGFIAHDSAFTPQQVMDSVALVNGVYDDSDDDGVWDLFDLDNNNDGNLDSVYDAALTRISDYAQSQAGAEEPNAADYQALGFPAISTYEATYNAWVQEGDSRR